MMKNVSDEDKAMFKKWEQGIHTKNTSELSQWLHDDVEFRSPAVFKPYKGKMVALALLSSVVQIFQNFTYHRVWIDRVGMKMMWALEFTADVYHDGKSSQIQGLDLIEFSGEKISRFDVLIRPLKGLSVLKDEMGKLLAREYPQYAAKARSKM